MTWVLKVFMNTACEQSQTGSRLMVLVCIEYGTFLPPSEGLGMARMLRLRHHEDEESI